MKAIRKVGEFQENSKTGWDPRRNKQIGIVPV